MELKVERKWPKDTYTVGRLYVDGKLFCNTLIPAGRYRVIFNWSPKFGRNLPRLLNVPHFEGILIHPGNTAADSAGCILVGKNSAVGRLSESRDTSDRLNVLIEDAQRRGEDIFITVE